MSNPSLEAVLSLKPDVVIMTTEGNPKEFEERLTSLKINTYVFGALTLNGLPQGIRSLAEALGVKDRGEKLAIRGTKGMVFREIYPERHKEWVDCVCHELGIEPIWGMNTGRASYLCHKPSAVPWKD
jgi:diphthamide synthase (EF-2-diphthine--ammonia ligase)